MISFVTAMRGFSSQLSFRLRHLPREALAQSLGVQVIAMFTLTISALCARIVITSYVAYYSAVASQLMTASAQGEPRSDLEFPAIFGAILSPVNSNLGQWSPEVLSPSEARRLTLLSETYVALSEYALAALRTSTTEEQKKRAIETFDARLSQLVPQADSVSSSVAWRQRVHDHFYQVLHPPATLLSVVDVPNGVSHSHRMAQQGPIGVLTLDRTDQSIAQTTLQVPSTFNPASREIPPHAPPTKRGKGGAMAARPAYSDSEVIISATTSAFLEDAIDLVRMRFGEMPSTGSRTPIVQAYFISERGVLRIWRAREPWTKLPTNRNWSSAHYFSRFYEQSHEKELEYMTPPYIDVGENGLVRTYLHIVRAMNRPDSSGVFGAIAVDYQLPLREYLDSLACHNVIFDLHRMQVPPGVSLRSLAEASACTLYAARPANGRQVDPRFLWRRVTDHDLLARVARYGVEHEERAQMSSLGMLAGFPEPEWILPLEAGGAKPATFLIIKPRTPRLPVDLYVYAMISLVLLTATLFLIFGWRGRVAEQERFLENATLVRNLSVGWFTVDDTGVIADSNHMAALLLETTLPQYGQYRGAYWESRKFSELVHSDVVEAETMDEVRGLAPTRTLDEVVAANRTPLRSSTYYAMVLETGRIVRVSGGPVIYKPQSRENAHPERSATLTIADPKVATFLSGAVESWREHGRG